MDGVAKPWISLEENGTSNASPKWTRDIEMILAYDADCGFCSASVTWLCGLRFREGHTLDVVPYQDPAITAKLPGVDLSHADGGVQLLLPNGVIRRDSDAIGEILVRSIKFATLGRWILLPGFRIIARIGYRIVARNRRLISRILGMNACRLPQNKTFR